MPEIIKLVWILILGTAIVLLALKVDRLERRVNHELVAPAIICSTDSGYIS